MTQVTRGRQIFLIHTRPCIPQPKGFVFRSRHNKGENKQFSRMRIREAGRALVGLSERPRHELLRPRNLMQEGLHRRKRPPNKQPHLCPVNGGRASFPELASAKGSRHSSWMQCQTKSQALSPRPSHVSPPTINIIKIRSSNEETFPPFGYLVC